MIRASAIIGLLSWFAGGVLLGTIELTSLPADPTLSTLIQLLPLIFLVGGIWFVVSQYQKIGSSHEPSSSRLKIAMTVGWIAFFGVDAGVASVNNMSTEIFHEQLPYFYQGVTLVQKMIALTGIFILGIAAIFAWRRSTEISTSRPSQSPDDFLDRPLTSIGFITLLFGVVLGLGQYWPPLVFAGFLLLLGGSMLYLCGKLTEKNTRPPVF